MPNASAEPGVGVWMRAAVPVFLFLLTWLVWLLRPGVLSRGWRVFSQAAAHRGLAIVAAGFMAIAIRVAALPLIPIPHPVLPDEFSHLLSAETLVRGRITNPTPPAWKNIESLFILYQPTYQSKYPIGQAAALAAGWKLLGHPWFGVLITFGVMVAATCWMLQGWVPPAWALLGATLLMLRMALFSDWINTYMGGTVAAIGGALTFGALPRLAKQPSGGLAAVFGLGIAVAMHTRPFESVMICVLACGFLWWWLGKSLPLARRLRVFIPIGAVVLAGLGIVLYQNWRITGSALLMPYQLNKKAQGTPQNFYWQAPAPPPPFRLQRIADMYQWQLSEYRKGSTLGGYFAQLKRKWITIFDFYLGYLLPAMICALIWRRDRRAAALFLIATATFLWSSMYGYFYEHYFAPLTGVFLALGLLGLETISGWKWRNAPVGAFAAVVLILSAIQTTPYQLVMTLRRPERLEELRFRKDLRREVEQRLTPVTGKHIVFARTRRGWLAPAVWFHNGPNPADSRVIWAQEIDAVTDREFLKAYPGRRIWTLDVDSPAPQPQPYRGPAAPEALTGAVK